MNYLVAVGPWAIAIVAFMVSWGRINADVSSLNARQDRFENQVLLELRDIKKILMARGHITDCPVINNGD